MMKYGTINQVFLFFVTLMLTIQYYGGISSVVFGVMGEVTDQPTVDNGHKLFKLGQANEILTAMASHSLLASVIGISMFYLIALNASYFVPLLSANVRILILTTVMVMLLVVSKQRWIGTLLLILGLLFGILGASMIPALTEIIPRFGFFGGGIPFAPFLAGFIIIPTLVSFIKSPTPISDVLLTKVSYADRFALLAKITHVPATLRGAAVGCLTGLIPGVSYTISSVVAESIEKIKHKKIETIQSMTQNLLAAEAATKAAVLTALVPLLIFGIPILPSEAMMLSIFEEKGITAQSGALLMQGHLFGIIALFVAIEVSNWLISGYFYTHIAKLYTMLGKYGYHFILAGVVTITVFSGLEDHSVLLTVVTLGVSTLIGFAVANTQTKLPMMFAFFISPVLLPDLYRLYLTHFA
jgi:putative tricarboxylic transport membrane protein